MATFADGGVYSQVVLVRDWGNSNSWPIRTMSPRTRRYNANLALWILDHPGYVGAH